MVVRRVPLGAGDDGPAAVPRGRPLRADGLPARRLPAGPASALSRRALRRHGRLLAGTRPRQAHDASAARLPAGVLRRARRFHLSLEENDGHDICGVWENKER